MTTGAYFRHLRRELRGSRSRLAFFVVCLALGVAAVVGVAGFCDALERGIRQSARQLLAADLVIRGRHPVPDAVIAALPGATAEIREMLTLVAKPVATPDDAAPASPRSLLSELKAVDGPYPFYGDLVLDPALPLAELLADDADGVGGVVVAPEVMRRLGLRLGDVLRVGEESFVVRGQVLAEPDRIANAFSLGPRVFVSLDGLERAALERIGSRVTYSVLAELPEGVDAAATARTLRPLLAVDGRHRVETWREGQPALRRGLRSTERYLGLAALLSLLVGGVGVAQTVRAWLVGRLDALAVLKCLGYRPRQALALDLGQIVALGALSSLVGIVLGLGAQQTAAWLLRDLLPVTHLPLWQPWAMLRGLGLGIGVALFFALPPLLAAQRVPPIRVLRRDAEPLPPSRLAQVLVGLVLVVGVAALAAAQAESWRLGLAFTGGLLVTVAVLLVAARALVGLAARPRRRARLVVRHGLAALARPGAGTLSAVVALGLGVLVIVLMSEVEGQLTTQLRRDLPAEAPTAFLIDIQPDQWAGVEALLEDGGAERIDSVPVVMARLAAIDGVPVEKIARRRGPAPDERSNRDGGDDSEGGDGDERWALRREQRLTYLERLPEDNLLVETVAGGEDGSPWRLAGVDEISLELEYAQDLGVELGTVLRFDIQGVPIDLTVSSLRTVDWATYGINFYLVVEPGVLDDAPQHRIAAARLPEGGEQRLQDALAGTYSNVTLIRTGEVLEKLAAILDQLGLGVRLLGLFTVFAGLAILAGAVAASALQRGREVALVKTLGMTRRQILAVFTIEYVTIGLVAGLLGALGGAVLAHLVLTRAMDIAASISITRPLATAAIAGLSTVLAGLLAGRGARRRRPIETLREAV